MFNCDCIDTWFIYFPFDQSSIIYRSKLQVQTLREIAIRYIPFIIIIERFNNLSLQIIQWSFIYKISSSYNTHIKLDTEQWQRREGFCVVLVKLSTITCNIWLIKIIASVVDHTGWRNKWSMKIYQTHVFFFFFFFFLYLPSPSILSQLKILSPSSYHPQNRISSLVTSMEFLWTHLFIERNI